jgi:hypothetical protein
LFAARLNFCACRDGQGWISPHSIFFFFLVGRYSFDFASPRGRKSLCGPRFGSGGEAKLSGFRLGGAAKPSLSEALFIASLSCGRSKPGEFTLDFARNAALLPEG